MRFITKEFTEKTITLPRIAGVTRIRNARAVRVEQTSDEFIISVTGPRAEFLYVDYAGVVVRYVHREGGEE